MRSPHKFQQMFGRRSLLQSRVLHQGDPDRHPVAVLPSYAVDVQFTDVCKIRRQRGRSSFELSATLLVQSDWRLWIDDFADAVQHAPTNEVEVSAKPATLERKDIQSTKPVLVWQLSHTSDHACGQALYARHQSDVSS